MAARRGAPVDAGVTTAIRARVITPDDDTNLPLGPCTAVIAGTEGTVVATLKDDADPITFNAAAGAVLPISARRIHESSTSTGMIALYNY